jgi:AP-3 complex subunit beta
MNKLFLNTVNYIKSKSEGSTGSPSPKTSSPTDIKTLLNSSSDKHRLNALRTLLQESESYSGTLLDHFADIIKNISSENHEIKTLVCSILARYSDLEPDLTLLAVNSLQKDLQNPDPVVRTNSLRAFSSMRLPVLLPIMLITCLNCCSDMNLMVRRECAYACIKIYNNFTLDDNISKLENIISILLNDKCLQIVTAAVLAFSKVCPDKVHLLQRNYSRICYLLLDAEEWSQPVILKVLVDYVRITFPEHMKESPNVAMLVANTTNLYYSRNSAVVLASCAAHHALTGEIPEMGLHALIRIMLIAGPSVQYAVLRIVFFTSIKYKV